MCHFLAPVGQPEMMHKNFMRRHLRISVARCSGMKFFWPFSAEHTANQATGFTTKSAAFFVLKNFLIFFAQGVKKWAFSLATYWGTKQVSSWSLKTEYTLNRYIPDRGRKPQPDEGAPRTSCPQGLSRKARSDSKPFWNIRLLRIRQS